MMKRLATVCGFVAFLLAAYTLLLNAQIANVPSGTWTAAPEAAMSATRADASSVQLADGRLLITGGLTGDPANPGVLRTAELFTLNGTFAQAASMITTRARHASVALADGRVLVTGGITEGGAETASAEIYDPAAGAWSGAGEMLVARSGHTMSLLNDGRVLIVGG